MAEEAFAGVPGNVRSLIDHIGLLDELINESAEEMYSHLREGECMTCHSELGEDTILLVNKHGVVAGYCGAPCMQDMAVLGWLQEQHDDIQDAIQFRGGKGDEVDG